MLYEDKGNSLNNLRLPKDGAKTKRADKIYEDIKKKVKHNGYNLMPNARCNPGIYIEKR